MGGLSRYERLEKLNNYMNLLSLVLLLAAMATIPVTYFSLKGLFFVLIQSYGSVERKKS